MTEPRKTRPRGTRPALEAARQKRPEDDGVMELSTGYRARLVPVAASLITEISAQIPDPEVPMWANPEKEGKEEPNPSDPAYLRGLQTAEQKRAEAVMDAMLLFGVDLDGGLPEDETWIRKLKYLVRLKRLDLGDFDLDDMIDREFLFKRYVAVSADDLAEIMRRSGVTKEAIAQAARNFPGDAVRPAD